MRSTRRNRGGPIGRGLAVLLMLVAAPSGRADEVRLRSGEVLHGAVAEDAHGRLVVLTTGGRRTVRAADIAERIEAAPPAEEVARRLASLAPDDADGRVALARFAWSRRLADSSVDLARAAAEIDREHAGAERWLGRVPGDAGWEAGWPAPWPPTSRVGKRWSGRLDADARRALDWLAAHQDESGRVDADGFGRHCPEGDACGGAGGGHHGERVPCAFDGVTTALAVLAWSAAGSQPTAGRYADEVARGLEVCLATTRAAGGFDGIWNLAYATQAVADVCLVSRRPDLRDALEGAVARLLALQRTDGGWSYVYAIGDVPTTSAVLVALGLSAQAGVGVPVRAISRALAFLESRVDAKTGKSEYHDGAEQKGYTPTTANAAATLAARAALGVLDATPDRARRVRAATGRKKPRWKLSFEEVETRDGRTVTAQVGNLYPYAWYLAAFALATSKSGGSWVRSAESAFRKGQRDDGHAAGSWDPLGPYSDSGGRAFVTGLGALTLLAARRFPRGP